MIKMNWQTKKPKLKKPCIVLCTTDTVKGWITFAYDFYLNEKKEWETVDTEGYYVGLDTLDFEYYAVIEYPQIKELGL